MTFVAQDGTVLQDSEARPERMENHRHRPELVAALAGREGSSVRPSPTIGVEFLYVAVPIDGGALRLAVPLSDIKHQVNAIRNQMLASTVIAFLPSVFIALVLLGYIALNHTTLGPRIYALGGIVSGHTLKHLLAAASVWWLLRMLQLRVPRR